MNTVVVVVVFGDRFSRVWSRGETHARRIQQQDRGRRENRRRGRAAPLCRHGVILHTSHENGASPAEGVARSPHSRFFFGFWFSKVGLAFG